MQPHTLSKDVCELLDNCIDSIEALDGLLLLHADPSRFFALPELARSLGVTDLVARRAMLALRERGLALEIAAGAMFKLAPLEPLAHAAFSELARVYAEQRPAIVEHVAKRSMDRLRVLAQAFTHRRHA